MQQQRKILLIGANGSAGKSLLKQLAPKFETVALLRSEPKFDRSLYPKLTIIKGDAANQETLNKVTEGVDIIISSYHDASGGPHDHRDYINRLIVAMKKNSVKRLISVCGFGFLPISEGGPRLKDTEKNPPQYKQLNQDMLNGYQAIAATQLNYTYVACPLFQEEEKEGDYNIFEVVPQNVQWKVKTCHIAHFIEGEINNPKWERKIIGIANL